MTIHTNAMFVCRENAGNDQNKTKIQNARFKKKKKTQSQTQLYCF